MKSRTETTVSKILETDVFLQHAKLLKNTEESTFVCDQNDKDCWHRYLSATGDCV